MVKSISETQDIINKAILDNDFDKAQQIIDKAISSNQLISRYFKTAAMFLEKINPNNKTEVYLNNPFNYIIRHKLLSKNINSDEIKENFLGKDNLVESDYMTADSFDIFKIPDLSNQISSSYIDYFDKLTKENFSYTKYISNNINLISFYISNITKKTIPGFSSDRSLINGIVLLNNFNKKFDKLKIGFDYIIGGPYDDIIDVKDLKKTITVTEPEIIYFPSALNYSISTSGNLKKFQMLNILFNPE